jgi:ADP-heptose:LPS heptosyltransferase
MKKIAIIKLGAKGDVIRTLPIVKAIKEKNNSSEIFWITKRNVKEILEGISFINEIFVVPYGGERSFDVLYNFDIEDEATLLASKLKAKEKYGFYKEGDFVSAFNLGAEYYLNTLFDDEVKKTNTKTYQEMMFLAAEITPNKQHVGIELGKEDLVYAEEFIKRNKLKTDKLVGIHMGASPRWPSKIWHEDILEEFIRKAKDNGYQILLFGGPDETERHENLVKKLENKGIKIYRNNPANTDKQFASLINLCKAVVCSDSFALHVSIALKKPTVGLFFCTSPNEVEPYSYLRKIVSPMLYDFFPERMDQYNEELTKSISANEVLSSLEEII